MRRVCSPGFSDPIGRGVCRRHSAAPDEAGSPCAARSRCSIDGKVLAIRTENGQDVMAAVSDKTRFATVERRNFDQLKPTDFVGITAVPGRNGHLRAEEVHIIPFVGLGEGHYPWDHHPGGNTMSTMGSMTNGTVAPAAAAGSMTNGTVMAGGRAHELHVTYRGAGLVNGQCAGRDNPRTDGLYRDRDCRRAVERTDCGDRRRDPVRREARSGHRRGRADRCGWPCIPRLRNRRKERRKALNSRPILPFIKSFP